MDYKTTYKNPCTYWTVTPLTVILKVRDNETDKPIADIEWDKETFFREMKKLKDYEKDRGVING